MLPPAAATQLCGHGHDAVSVRNIGLAGAEDADVYGRAVAEARVMVTENFADYANLVQGRHARGESCVAVVFVRRDDFARSGAFAGQLARRLHRWTVANPEPFVGVYWP